VIALLMGIVFHGTTMFFTLEQTYDALIHVFFGNHYAENWFESWNYSWYTGFTVLGYPPLVHQVIGLLSLVGGLKFGMFVVALIGSVLFVSGVYRFSLLIVANKKMAGYAAILAVFSSSFIETLHIFGQLPSIIGISVLMHALPEIYYWVKTNKGIYLATSLSLLTITIVSHHVTPIFGMIFFIFPTIGMAIIDLGISKSVGPKKISLKIFISTLLKRIWSIILFGFTALSLIIICILPYWINTKNNPITQVPIPHGSRDNFLEVLSSGLVFFVIPWGILLFILPFIVSRFFSKRLLFFGISFVLLFLLGTGGTTPLPKAILGDNAFSILTLDRFTLWASIMALPIFGEFIYRFSEGDIKTNIQYKVGSFIHRTLGGILAATFIFMAIFTLVLGKFRPNQPDPIDMLPIVNFLNEDEHYKWRYLPLGFGDQMAWLSTQTKATTVDGNYHSARRLPELTTKAVERLENSKYRGVEGIGSLQQFLTIPEKYHLKYIFSNDKFYDPLLYFSGWQKLNTLENGIVVWEKAGIPQLPVFKKIESAPLYQRLMWGIIPVSTIFIAIFILIIKYARPKETLLAFEENQKRNGQKRFKIRAFKIFFIVWNLVLISIILKSTHSFYLKNQDQINPTNTVHAYFDALDFKEFSRAHSYLNPNSEKTLSQFMLEISVTDGLLSSYAKLNSLSVEIESVSDMKSNAFVTALWITALKNIETKHNLSLEKIDSKWYITPENYDPKIPPDQFISQTLPVFYNHGKRKVTAKKTFHEDVLKQPEIEVLQAQLIQYEDTFAIVGVLQNIDNIPATISVTGSLYGNNNLKIASYNAMDIVKHNLLPKEKTPFRINFESIAWLENTAQKPTVFDPEQKQDFISTETPKSFGIEVKANVLAQDVVPQFALSKKTLDENTIKGLLFNANTYAVTIPQLLISYYDPEGVLVWVEANYINESIRPQRKIPFHISKAKNIKYNIIDSNMHNIYVNGLRNIEISKRIKPYRKKAFENRNIENIKVTPNGYIPKKK